MSDYTERIGRLQHELKEIGASGIVLAGTDQMRYLTGWKEGGHERFVGLLVPRDGEPVFVVPEMNAEQARHTPAGIARVAGWGDATGWHGAVAEFVSNWSSKEHILVDDELLSVHLLGLQNLFPETRFAAAGEIMTRLRAVKTCDELAAMEQAAATIDAVFEEVALLLRAGITELEAAELVLNAIRAREASPSFRPLICFGSNAAMPHHHTGTERLEAGDIVIIDIGSLSDGYASDITRTVAFGEPIDPDARRVYEIVYRAHMAARQAVKAGVTGEQVDAAARSIITAEGFGDKFVHRTGHGIGLSVHEPPNIVQGSTSPLNPGACFSVEPGIYLNGRFGVRIENIVTVTEHGARSLNAEPDSQLRVLPAR